MLPNARTCAMRHSGARRVTATSTRVVRVNRSQRRSLHHATKWRATSWLNSSSVSRQRSIGPSVKHGTMRLSHPRRGSADDLGHLGRRPHDRGATSPSRCLASQDSSVLRRRAPGRSLDGRRIRPIASQCRRATRLHSARSSGVVQAFRPTRARRRSPWSFRRPRTPSSTGTVLDGSRVVGRVVHREVRALEGRGLLDEEAVHDRDELVEAVDALGDRAELDAVAGVLVLLPARNPARRWPAAADLIESR